MQTSRERKIEFLRSFGDRAIEKAVANRLLTQGLDFLTDEQVETLTSLQVETWCSQQRANRRFRSAMRAKQAFHDLTLMSA